MRTAPRFTISLALSALLGAVACGDGGDDGSNGDTDIPESTGQIRFLNALSPGFGARDIYVATDLEAGPIVANLGLDRVSESLELPAGTTSFRVVAAGAGPDAADARELRGIRILEDRQVMLALYLSDSDPPQVEPASLEDDLADPTAGNATFRFVNVDSTYTASNLQLWSATDNRSPEDNLGQVSIGQASSSDFQIPVGEFVLGVSARGRPEPDVAFPFTVGSGSFRAFLALEERLLLVNDNYDVQVVQGQEFMGPGEGQLNFVHLADGAGPVDVYLVGSSEEPEISVSNLAEGASSGLRTTVADTYEIQVFQAGVDPSGTPVVTTEGFVLDDGQTRTVAVYDSDEGAEILALSPETTGGLQPGQVRLRVVHLDREFGPVDITNAESGDFMMASPFDPSFNQLGFEEVTEYVTPNIPGDGGLDLGVDADDRDDWEVIYTADTLQANDVVNVFLDRDFDMNGNPMQPKALVVPLARSAQEATREIIPDPSDIRIMHVSPGSPSVDLFLGTDKVDGQQNVPFGGSAPGYTQVTAGAALASFVEAGQASAASAFARATLDLEVDARQTIVVYGRNPGGAADDRADVAIIRDNPEPPTGNFRIRFFHAGRQAGGPLGDASFEIVGDQTANLGAASYGGVTNAQELSPASANDLTAVARIGANEFRFPLPDLQAGRDYTGYLVNDFFQSPALVSLVLQDQDGNTQSVRRLSEVRLAHFLSLPSPGQGTQARLELETLDGNPVDLTALDGTVVNAIDGIPFASVSGVFEIPEDQYLASVFVDGQPFIDQQQIRTVADELTTVAAVGDGPTQMPGTSPTVVVTEEPGPASAPAGQIEWRFAHGVIPDLLGGATAVDVFDLVNNPGMPAASALSYGVGVSSFFTGPAASSFDVGLEWDMMATGLEATFEVPALEETRSYTFYLVQDGYVGQNPMPQVDRGPLVLYAVSNQVSSTTQPAVVAGALSDLELFHLASGVGPVDVFVNGNMTPVATSVGFGQSSSVEVPSGRSTEFAVAAEGEDIQDAILTFNGPVFSTVSNTAYAYVDFQGTAQGDVLQNDPSPPMTPGDFRVRIVHSAGGFGDVDLLDRDAGMAIARVVPEGANTGYLEADPGAGLDVGIDILATNSSQLMMGTNDLDTAFQVAGLAPDSIYNAFLVADAVDNSVEVLLQQTDVSGAPVLRLDPPARVRIGNFAPNNPAADLYVDGNRVGSDASLGSPGNFDGASPWAFVQAPGNPVTVAAVEPGQMPGMGTLADLTTQLEAGKSYTFVLGETGPSGSATQELVEVEHSYFGIGPAGRVQGVHVAEGVGTVDVYDTSGGGSNQLFSSLASGGVTGPADVAAGMMSNLRVSLDLDGSPPVDDVSTSFSTGYMTPGMFGTLIFLDLGGSPAAALVRGDGSFEFDLMVP
jgi:hypothetical protein